jgi:2-polyprenyl-3-methyl-5-hydroxy-6-metoxy-1,4-benzoquinol methylase
VTQEKICVKKNIYLVAPVFAMNSQEEGNTMKNKSLVATVFAITIGSPMQSPSNQPNINELNRKCYDARADYWDRLPFPEFLPQAILRAHDPHGGWKAIDIGSGTGRLASWLANHGYEVLCLDPSGEMVRRTKALGFPTLQSTIQEFTTAEKFDLVLAILSLIHVPKSEMPQQIEKISVMLVSKGVFALAMIKGQGEGVGETASEYPRYFAYYTRQEIMNLTRDRFDLIDELQVNGPVSYIVFVFRKR